MLIESFSLPYGTPLNTTQASLISRPKDKTAFPKFVISLFFKQPSCSRNSTDVFHKSLFGSSSHDNFSGLSTPHSAHSRTSSLKSVRKISGGTSLVLTSYSFQSRIHFPALTRPALPFLYSASNKDSLRVTSVSIPVFLLNVFTLDNPVSTTTATSGTVNEVCAIALERITLVEEAAAGSRRTFLCSSKLTLLCRTKISASHFFASSSSFVFLISFMPGKNTRML